MNPKKPLKLACLILVSGRFRTMILTWQPIGMCYAVRNNLLKQKTYKYGKLVVERQKKKKLPVIINSYDNWLREH